MLYQAFTLSQRVSGQLVTLLLMCHRIVLLVRTLVGSSLKDIVNTSLHSWH